MTLKPGAWSPSCSAPDVSASGQRSRLRTYALVLAMAACNSRRGGDSRDAAAVALVGPSASPSASSAPAASARTVKGPPPEPVVLPLTDAGSGACKLSSGPTLAPFLGPAVLRPSRAGDGVELVYNDAGAPRVFPSNAAAQPNAPKPDKSTIPACAIAGDTFFCPDASGAIHRSRGPGQDEKIVANARPGAGVAAEQIGGRAVVAYLAERLTSEGLVREAWAALDGASPVRISEDGSGATSIDLAPRGEGLLALTIDARVAMTPIHARPLSLEGDRLRLGTDAVVFVGGPAERHTTGALATSKNGSAFALIAVAEDVLRFGLAAVRIDDPPADDSRAVWSFYPSGLDPATVAATRDESSMHVARVRTKTPVPDTPHVLEIGMLDESGAFRPSCTVTQASFVKDVQVARDRQGKVWVFYRTPAGSYLARVAA